MREIHQRQKRLELKRKSDIIEKEQRSASKLDRQKVAEFKIRSASYMANLHSLIERNDYSETMREWANSGFTRMPLMAKPEIVMELESIFKVKKPNKKSEEA